MLRRRVSIPATRSQWVQPVSGVGQAPTTLVIMSTTRCFWLGHRRRMAGFVVPGAVSEAIITVSVVAFESLGVATVLPVIAGSCTAWGAYGRGLSALILANIVGAVVTGRAADRLGPWAPFAMAVAVFVVGCLVAAASPTWLLFLCGRAMQGLGVGAVMSIAFMSIGTTYPNHLRPRVAGGRLRRGARSGRGSQRERIAGTAWTSGLTSAHDSSGTSRRANSSSRSFSRERRTTGPDRELLI